MKDRIKMYRLEICTPCPICGTRGGILMSKDGIRQDGNYIKWPCGAKQVLRGEDWITVKRCNQEEK